ncbi:c-type heme family protein [Bremerella sp. P1]|uniref:c-type heme family protein n=1 Tax=Bremerella sp. P1 TaxID=3026424 RepID=UPI002368B798|nr:DUF3365 domain-containing protein [Bremerella sp. P1]WDI42135.1 DUF3365 domain-containing protein [Bremerella sp. P1]
MPSLSRVQGDIWIKNAARHLRTALPLVVILLATSLGQADPPEISAPTSQAEARARAMLLHETIHGTLQVVHRDFFLEDESRVIPSASMEDVFQSLEESYNVHLKWLVVETDVVNVDHKPEGAFEKAAVKALADRKPYLDAVEKDTYRFAGPIRLASQCLKCHVRNRKDTEDRTAGLIISMPILLDRQ